MTGEFSGTQGWTLNAPVTLEKDGVTIGTIDWLDVSVIADPEVDLQFAFTNGSATEDASSASDDHHRLRRNRQSRNGGHCHDDAHRWRRRPAGATVAGAFPDGSIYQARYSTHAVNNTQTVFASLMPGFSLADGVLTDVQFGDAWIRPCRDRLHDGE